MPSGRDCDLKLHHQKPIRYLSTSLPGLVSVVAMTLITCNQANGPDGDAEVSPDPKVCQTYVRDDFHYGLDEDGDCQYTRAELLIATSKMPVTYTSSKHCSVDSGLWYDPYSDHSYNKASELEIDHIVALSEAFKSGAWQWSVSRKTAFANDPLNLMAVQAKANQDKGDKDPGEWLPPNANYVSDYVRRFSEVKAKYGLAFDSAEAAAIRAIDPGINLAKVEEEYRCTAP